MNVISNPTAAGLESLVGRAADQFTEDVNQGRSPSIEEYSQRYPEIANIIRQVFPALAVLEGASPIADENGHSDSPRGDVLHEGPVAGVLGDFCILGEIGRGGMGVVYEAEQISLGRRVALKVLPFAAMLDKQQLARFKNEARAAATLDHANIVAIYSVGVERSVHYYAMQLIEGQSLAEVIAAMRQENGRTAEQKSGRAESQTSRGADPTTNYSATPLLHHPTPPSPRPHQPSTMAHAHLSTIDEPHSLLAPRSSLPAFSSREYYRTIAQLGIQAAEALDHAHQNGILHRDIKPANLLLDDSGKLWITDFGLARIEADAGLTTTGDLMGTLRYMSPEQALAKRVVVDHRGDIYSLGVTLYELLTLQPAYPADDRQELLRQIAFEEPEPPRKLNRRIPIDLQTIILTSIAKNRDDRYISAKQLADDLSAFLDHRAITAKPPSLLHRTVRWSRRHYLAVVASGSALIASRLGAWYGSAIANQREEPGALVSELTKDTHASSNSRLANPPIQELPRIDELRELIDSLRRLLPDPTSSTADLGDVHHNWSWHGILAATNCLRILEEGGKLDYDDLLNNLEVMCALLYDEGFEDSAAKFIKLWFRIRRLSVELSSHPIYALSRLAFLRVVWPQENLRDADEAERILKEVLASNIRETDSMYQRMIWWPSGVMAFAHLHCGHWERAMRTMHESIALGRQIGRSESAMDWALLAVAHLRIGQQAEAYDWYAKSISKLRTPNYYTDFYERHYIKGVEALFADPPSIAYDNRDSEHQ